MPRSLAHRQRVLLHTAALHDVRRAQVHQTAELKHYDLLQVAVALLDLVVDSMGLDHELDRDDIVRALAPLLREMDRTAGGMFTSVPDIEKRDELLWLVVKRQIAASERFVDARERASQERFALPIVSLHVGK
jgi:hypothetical protein